MSNIEEAVIKSLKIMDEDPNNRYVSFEHFHKFFLSDIQETEEDLNQLTLHLFAYLASWGMLRGSTFSLQKDYLFHRPVAEVLLKWKSEMGYLIDLPCEGMREEEIDAITKLKDEITERYKGKEYWKPDKNNSFTEKTIEQVSDVLVSKILLGSFACVPAYDEYVRRGLKKTGFSQSLDKESLRQLIGFAKEHSEEIQKAADLCWEKRGIKYSDMKILDMYFFECGAGI